MGKKLALISLLGVGSFLTHPCLAAVPSLSILELPNGQLQVTWPANAPSLSLEQADSLAAPGSWREVEAAVVDIGGAFSVQIQPSVQTRFYRLRGGAASIALIETSPALGESGVAVTRETIFRLPAPLAADVVVTLDHLFAEFGGRRLLTRTELSSDHRTITLFYLENLPANALVRVSLVGEGLRDASGQSLDADGDGQPGGTHALEFTTASISGLPNTAVTGRVFASELGAAGANRPLQGVIVTVDGAEETLRTATDATGFFKLQPAPSGRVFVHVDGRTAVGSEWPKGAYYPFVGKAWSVVPGVTNNLAGGSGEIFLPLIQADALKVVSATEETKITFSPSVIAANPSLAGVEVRVPPNTLFNGNGARGGMVGMAPVAPDRLPEPLPAGLNLPLVITIQTDGAQNFDRPVPVRFPNLPDPVTGVKLGSGAKTVLWSFNHDTGRWEAQGTATITPDGQFAVTDPGVGVRQPGWHGVAPGTTGHFCPPDCPRQIPVPDCDNQKLKTTFVSVDCATDGITSAIPKRGAVGCALGAATGSWRTARDCMFLNLDDCGPSAWGNTKSFLIGCVPVAGDWYNQFKCGMDTAEELQKLYDCREAERRRGKLSVSSVPPEFAAMAQAFADQEVLNEALHNLIVTVLGSPVWGAPQIDFADAAYIQFFTQFDAAVQPGSPGGENFAADERAALLALPTPPGVSVGDVQSLLDRFQKLIAGDIKLAANRNAIGQAYDKAIMAVEAVEAKGWKTPFDGFLRGMEIISEFLEPNPPGSPIPSSSIVDNFPVGPHYYALVNFESGFVQRGQLSPTGRLDNLILAAETFYAISYFMPSSSVGPRIGTAIFRSAPVGADTRILFAVMIPDEGVDSDADGVSENAELVVGTGSGNADSDGDGVPDGIELARGSNPLDGQPAALGVISAIDTSGTAVDVFAWNDLAAVADGKAGVALFSVANPRAPVFLAEVDTPGTATAVAGSGSVLAVADGFGGISVFDVSQPALPLSIGQVALGSQAQAVTFATGGFIVAGLVDGSVKLVSGAGEVLHQIDSAGWVVQDVLATRDLIFVLKGNGLQLSIDTLVISNLALSTVSSTTILGHGLNQVRLRLSTDGNRLFVAERQGFNAFELSPASTPTLVQELMTGSFGWKQMVSDGGGLGLAAVGPNSTLDGAHDVSLYTLGPTGTGTNFVTAFATPGLAYAVCLYRGVALVADGDNGLSVVEFAPPDRERQAPTVTLAGTFQPGPVAQESAALFRLSAAARDDARVRVVEFFIDGQLVTIDGNPPFEVELTAPNLTSTKPSFAVQAIAFDTAGTSSTSAVLTVPLSPDTTGPVVMGVTPVAESGFLVGTTVSVSARFNEPLAAATLNAGFTLTHLGADAQLGTPDDVPVPTTVTSGGTNEYVLDFSQPLPLGTYAAKLRVSLSDVVGNGLPAESSRRFRIQPLIQFDGVSNPVWSSAPENATNWSSDQNPTLTDFVQIALPGNVVLPVRGQVAAFDLTVKSPLNFGGGIDPSLRVGHRAVFEGPVTLNSGKWQGGEVTLRGETQISGFMVLLDQDWNNEGHVTLGPAAVLTSGNSPGRTTTLRNLPGATWEVVDSKMGSGSLGSGPVDFENQGLLITRGTNRNFIGTSRFINLGSVEVREGILDMRAGSVNEGASQHLGNYRVDTGATLQFIGLNQFGRATRIFGGGNVTIDGGLFPGSYELDGKTTVSRDVTFSGPVRSSGAWRIFTGHATFTGLNPEITGPFSVEASGMLTVAVQPLMRLNELIVSGDLEITTALEVNGPLRLNPTPISRVGLLGDGRLRANGPLTFVGTVRSVGKGTLEIGGSATCQPGAQLALGGSEIRVLPGGTFDVSGAEIVNPRAPLINKGTLLKTNASTMLLGQGLQNRGTLRVSVGTLQVRRGFEQSAGLLVLADGHLFVGTTGPGGQLLTVDLAGGKLEGAGKLTCALVTNSAEIAPGSPIGILDLQLGDRVDLPLFSVYQQTAAGKLTIDIAGAAPGTGHDQVSIAGRAVLGGKLEIKVDPTYDPPAGQEFTILTCKKREGTFAEVIAAALPGGKRFEVSYGNTGVKLRVAL